MKIAGIQYLRAIAALAVVVAHAAGTASFDKYFGSEAVFFDFWTHGWLGVQLFFVISGFIIVVSSFSAGNGTPTKSFMHFLTARAGRILPMMWLAIVSFAVMRWFARGALEPIPYLNAFFLLPFGEYDPKQIWTLRHEAIFYLVFGFSFLLNPRMRPVFLVWVAVPVVVYAVPSIGSNWGTTVLGQSLGNVFAVHNVFFGAGALIGYVYVRRPDVIERLARSPARHVVSMPALVSLFCLVVLSSMTRETFDQVVLLSLIAFSATVLMCTIELTKVNRIAYYLGNASFSIYLFHPHIESTLLSILAAVAPDLNVNVVVALVSAAAVAGGAVIYSFVERPITRSVGRVTLARFRPVQAE